MQAYIVLDLDDSFTLDSTVLDILLKDRTTKHNIIWATEDYSEFGDSFAAESEIESHLFRGINVAVSIRPRTAKPGEKQNGRTREKAEVFTPAWLCNEQNNLIDEQWFGRNNIFNRQANKTWHVNKDKVAFLDSKSRTWQDYVDARRMEISCGEAPYLVSRYDTVTGRNIDLHRRIGLLDRKLRVVNENADNEDDWLEWTTRAYQSTYGYEYQGDNLLIARANLLYTFVDNMRLKFNQLPSIDELQKIATIISWNLWQMDGTTCAVPLSNADGWSMQMSIFDSIDDNQNKQDFCKIMDWRSKKTVEYAALVEGVN